MHTPHDTCDLHTTHHQFSNHTDIQASHHHVHAVVYHQWSQKCIPDERPSAVCERKPHVSQPQGQVYQTVSTRKQFGYDVTLSVLYSYSVISTLI